MKKITLLLMALFAATGQAQTFQWVKNPPIDFSSNSGMIGYSTAVDASGNSYFAGFKENTFVYSNIMGTQYYNKYDTVGNLIFSKTITGNADVYCIVPDSAGNILMSVGYVNNITIGTLSLSTINQGVQYLLVKFDADGNLLWHKPITITDSFVNTFRTIVLDSADNIYIGYDDYGKCYVQKLLPDGTPVLTIQQHNVSRVTSISVDNEGNIYATGSCANENSFYAGVAGPTALTYNTYAVKYSPAGAFQWIKYIDDITCPDPMIVAANSDEIYFSSSLFGNYTFGSISTEGPISGMFSDFFIAKLNGAGDFQWVREVPGAGRVDVGSRNYLTTDAQGNVYLAGSNFGTINWGNNINTTVTGGSNGIILKYSPAGNLLMAKTAGGASQDRFDGMAVAASGDIFVAGMANGNATFDGIDNVTTQIGYYPFLAKIGGFMGTDGRSLAQVSLYPNPADGTLCLANLPADTKGEIVNMLGQLVKKFNISPGQSIAIHDLPAGTYVLKPEGSKALKFIKK